MGCRVMLNNPTENGSFGSSVQSAGCRVKDVDLSGINDETVCQIKFNTDRWGAKKYVSNQNI